MLFAVATITINTAAQPATTLCASLANDFGGECSALSNGGFTLRSESGLGYKNGGMDNDGGGFDAENFCLLALYGESAPSYTAKGVFRDAAFRVGGARWFRHIHGLNRARLNTTIEDLGMFYGPCCYDSWTELTCHFEDVEPITTTSATSTASSTASSTATSTTAAANDDKRCAEHIGAGAEGDCRANEYCVWQEGRGICFDRYMVGIPLTDWASFDTKQTIEYSNMLPESMWLEIDAFVRSDSAWPLNFDEVERLCLTRQLEVCKPEFDDVGTVCAVEGGVCACDGQVRYGKVVLAHPSEEVWPWSEYVDVSGKIACNSDVFGDPIPGTVKECRCIRNTDTTSSTAPPVTTTSGAEGSGDIADEPETTSDVTTAAPTTVAEAALNLNSAAEGSADDGTTDDGMGVAAAAGGAGAAVGVLALVAVAVTRKRRSDARDLVDDVEAGAGASIAPPPRSSPGSVRWGASEYEVPAVGFEATGSGEAVYDMVDAGPDVTYEVADGEAEVPSYTNAAVDYSQAATTFDEAYTLADADAAATYALADGSAIDAVYHTAAATTLRRESREAIETLRRSSQQLEQAISAAGPQ